MQNHILFCNKIFNFYLKKNKIKIIYLYILYKIKIE